MYFQPRPGSEKEESTNCQLGRTREVQEAVGSWVRRGATTLMLCRSSSGPPRQTSQASSGTEAVVDDYANLQGPSLLKRTLGLQNHRHARYIGSSSEYDSVLLDLRLYDDVRGESEADRGPFRKVGESTIFSMLSRVSI